MPKTTPEHGKLLDKGAKKVTDGTSRDPDWATGLKRLYDSVVDEPLPDLFTDLLSRLDQDHSKPDRDGAQ